jgi:hypothetical protein
LRFQNKKISARATALALVLGVVGVLVTALPAFAAADTVTSFTPICGVVGTAVSITGTGFTAGATASSVTFPGGIAQAIVPASDTLINTTVPATSTGTAQLVVVDADGNGTSPLSFQVVTPAVAPTITSFSPPTGAVGASVVIVGSGFCGATTVQFNTTAATFTVNSNNQITATVPAGSTTGPIHVTSGAGTIASGTNFTPTSATSITSFTPTSGPVGTSVVITGTNLLGVTSVKFNGVTATFSANTATSVTAVVPTGATTGPIVVVDTAGTATSTTSFTVTTGPVTRSVSGFGFQPNSRVSGTVTVTGGSSACHSFVPVVIQKQKNGAWKWVDTTATTASGSFKTYIPPSHGNFRAKVNQLTLANGVVCGADTSNVVHS